MTVDERRLREAVQYAEAAMRLAEDGEDRSFWRGWRAAMLTELERLTRPDLAYLYPPQPPVPIPGLGEGANLAGAESALTPGPAPSSSPDLRIVR